MFGFWWRLPVFKQRVNQKLQALMWYPAHSIKLHVVLEVTIQQAVVGSGIISNLYTLFRLSFSLIEEKDGHIKLSQVLYWLGGSVPFSDENNMWLYSQIG